jgi:hypothetical protein
MTSRDRITNRWVVGEYTITEYADVWGGEDVTTYATKIGDQRESIWRHLSLDKALLAVVAEKHTGPPMAGGGGVGSAADWFALAIGLEKHE